MYGVAARNSGAPDTSFLHAYNTQDLSVNEYEFEVTNYYLITQMHCVRK